MENLNFPPKVNAEISAFIQNLKKIYAEDLVSIILYGSASSGEFVPGHSNLNVLVVLKSTELSSLKKAAKIIKRCVNLYPLFLTKDYICSSVDVFPIEFIDMQENYRVLYGEDFLKELTVDLKNLRFQCEQELKGRLLNLKQLYLRLGDRPEKLKEPLLKSFTSILHILRNALRLKGTKPAYQKEALLKELAQHFTLDRISWEKILAAKLKKIRLSTADSEQLFYALVGDLEKISKEIDAL